MDYLRGKLFHFLHNPLTQTFSEFLRHGDRALWMTSPRNVIIMIFEINSISHVSDMYSIVYSSLTNQNTKDPFPPATEFPSIIHRLFLYLVSMLNVERMKRGITG